MDIIRPTSGSCIPSRADPNESTHIKATFPCAFVSRKVDSTARPFRFEKPATSCRLHVLVTCRSFKSVNDSTISPNGKKRKSRERENKTKIPLRAVARQKVTGSSRHRSATDHCLSLRTPFVKCRIIPSNSFFWIRFPFYLPPPPHAPLVYPPPARTAICRCSRALPSAGAHAHSTATG